MFCFSLAEIVVNSTRRNSEFYYCRKFSLCNLSCLGLYAKQGYCYVWEKSIARIGANKIASYLYNLTELHCCSDSMEISLLTGNCRGQWFSCTVRIFRLWNCFLWNFFSQTWSHTEWKWKWFNTFCNRAKNKRSFNLSSLSMDNINRKCQKIKAIYWISNVPRRFPTFSNRYEWQVQFLDQ